MIATAPSLVLHATSPERTLAGLLHIDHDSHCAQCARPIHAGEPVRPTSHLPKTFTDQATLIPGAMAICSDCVTISSQRYMQALATAVTTLDGIYACRKSADLAFWIVNPPDGPWTFTISTAQMQHIHWKATVNTSRDLFSFCLDGRVFPVRRQRLLAAAIESQAFFKALDDAPPPAGKKKPYRPRYLVRTNLDVPFSAVTDSAATDAHRRLIAGLLPGELWLLCRIQNQNLSEPNHPPSLIQ